MFPFFFIVKDSTCRPSWDETGRQRGSGLLSEFQVWIFRRPILPKSVMDRATGAAAMVGAAPA
jgi:hypothetical protein